MRIQGHQKLRRQRYRQQPGLDARKYDKVLISRMTVTLKPYQHQGIDPTDLKTMIDYFHNALVKAIEPQMQVVEGAGPGVLGIRIALTDLVPTRVSRSLTGTLVPLGFGAFSISQKNKTVDLRNVTTEPLARQVPDPGPKYYSVLQLKPEDDAVHLEILH